MACELTTGFTLGCLEGIGGVKEVFIANYGDFETGIAYGGTDGEVDALPTATIYRYVPFRNSGSYVETVNKNLETGTLFFSQEVGWTFGKLNQEMRNEFLNVAKAKMIVFVRTNDDQILLVGAGEGSQLTAGTVQSGAQKADLMGYQVTTVAEDLTPAVHLEPFTTVPFDNFAGITVSPAY
jgi:hypothetical protein